MSLTFGIPNDYFIRRCRTMVMLATLKNQALALKGDALSMCRMVAITLIAFASIYHAEAEAGMDGLFVVLHGT